MRKGRSGIPSRKYLKNISDGTDSSETVADGIQCRKRKADDGSSAVNGGKVPTRTTPTASKLTNRFIGNTL